MKQVLFSFTFIILLGFIYAFAKGNFDNLSDVKGDCIENKNLYEPILNPTATDTNNFKKIKNRFAHVIDTINFNYYDLPIMHGLIDTHKLSFSEFSKGSIPNHFKRTLAFSPLIIEGTVVNMFPTDTITDDKYMFLTNIMIKVDAILKSKYKIHIGDYILAKTDLYGYIRLNTGEIGHVVTCEISGYRVGGKYLFALNKYGYMRLISLYQNEGIKDVYCPYAFCLNIADHDLSAAVKNNEVSINDIINFLK